MPGLLEKLRLKRKPKASRQTAQTVVQPVNPVVPPPVAVPPPAMTPEQAHAAMARQAETDKRNFEDKLDEAMPQIHAAKQFILAVDGQRLAAVKTAADSPRAVALNKLADELLPQIKKLDDHGKEVRKLAAATNYLNAKAEAEKALTLANAVLARQEEFATALSLDAPKVPEVPEEERAFREELKQARASLDKLLSEPSGNRAVTTEQRAIAEELTEVESKGKNREFAAAREQLNTTLKNGEVLATILEAAKKYERTLTELEPLLQSVKSIDPHDPDLGARRGMVFDQVMQADHQAGIGNFVAALSMLDDVRKDAENLAPHEEMAARVYPQQRAHVEERAKLALAIEVPCQEALDRKEDIRTLLARADKANSERRFDEAFNDLDTVLALCGYIEHLRSSWQVYAASEAQAQIVLQSARNLKPMKQDQLKQQKLLATTRDQAARYAMEGKFSQAESALSQAVAIAEKLVAAVASPTALAYYKELADCQAELDAAAALKSPAALVVQAQRLLAEARTDSDNSLKGGDFDHARFTLGIAQTRAAEVQRLAAAFAGFDQAEKGFADRFALAQNADSKIAAIAALQPQLVKELAEARGALATDPVKAQTLLRVALQTANKIIGQAEGVQLQAQRSKDLHESLDKVRATYLPPGSTDQLAQDATLKDGGLFDAFVVAMKAAEDDKSNEKLDAMYKAAEGYLKSIAKATPEQQADPTFKRRKAAAETGRKQARHLKLANRGQALGPPPWPQEKEDEAADLYMQVLFETGNLPMEGAGASAYGAKWIMSQDFEKDKGKRNFIFKAQESVSPEMEAVAIPGFAPGSEPTREVLGDELNRQLKAQTGLDFNVPETRVVKIDAGKLSPDASGKEVLGSAQAAAPTIGGIVDLRAKNPDALKKIPPKSAQKAAIFDAMSLNMDRHSGNFLVTPPDKDGLSDLVPIDNGLAFPTRDGLESRRGRMAHGSAFKDIPAAFEKFDPDMLAAIDAINPEEIIDGLKKRRDSMGQQHPEMKGAVAAVSDESLDMIRRSVQFLKKAAPKLSPAVLMDALLEKASEIFDSPEFEREEIFEKIIAELEERQKNIGPIIAMNDADRKKMMSTLYELGWNLGFDDPGGGWGQGASQWGVFLRRNPKLATTLYAKNKPNPECLRQTKEFVDRVLAANPDSDIAATIKPLAPVRAFEQARKFAQEADENKRKTKLQEEFQRLFKGQTLPDNNEERQKFERFLKYGGPLIREVGKKRVDRLKWPDRYDAVEELVGQTHEDQLLQSLKESSEYAELNDLLHRYADVEVRGNTVDSLQAQITAWRELKALGGLKTYFDYGGNYEALAGGAVDALAFVKAAQSIKDISLD